jgi:uncharacterized protein YbcI
LADDIVAVAAIEERMLDPRRAVAEQTYDASYVRVPGSGPTRAKTSMSADLAIVIFGEYLTAAEKTLVREGHGKLARQFRTALHDGMPADAVAAVEEITGRQVAAYLTAHQHNPELAMIAFHFIPPAHLSGL